MTPPGPHGKRLADPQTQQVPPNARPRSDASHRVQFYAADGLMLDQVARFLRSGLDAGEAGLVVATAEHRDALKGRLGALAERIVFLDARATLEAFLQQGRLDEQRFEEVVGAAVQAATKAGNGRVRAFGEMVALLFAEGRAPLAIELEGAWNRLLRQSPLLLLCAYPLSVFPGKEGAEALRQVCAQHDQVEPAGEDGPGPQGEPRRSPPSPPEAPDVTDPAPDARRRIIERLTSRERQQAAVARIGHLALQRLPLDTFFAHVVREVAEASGADTCILMECIAGDQVQLRAGHGFEPGYAPRAPAGPGSHPHFILRSGRPVVYEDLRNEARFQPSPILLDAGIRSGTSVVVPTSRGPWGTIGMHLRSLQPFTTDDINFLEAVAHVLGSAIDRLRAEDELQRSRDHLEALVRERTQRLEHANRELDAFSSAVSHDLRGPVRAIAGFSALLAQRHAGRLDPHGRELLEEVRRAVARMGDLIEDLLDLSRADRALPNRYTVDLSFLAREILRAEAERNPTRSVAFDIEDDLVVQGDPDLLRMAMENLLSNAWKFTARTPDARITVARRGDGDEVVLCVQDNGAGFDMADAGRLFQPFQRLHRRSDYDGTGIGLATVRRIIERHGGRVWAQAKPGAGASFYFTLPSSGAPGAS